MHLFVAQSPLQVLLCNLSRKARGLSPGECRLFLIRGSHGNTNRQMGNIAAVADWATIDIVDLYPGPFVRKQGDAAAFSDKVEALRNYVSYIKETTSFQPGSFKSLTLGDIRELPALVIQELSGADRVYLVDDGSVAPQIAHHRSTYKWLKPEFDETNFRKKRFHKLIEALGNPYTLAGPKSVIYHSIYEFQVPLQDFYERLDPTLMDVAYLDLTALDETWIIGSNHVQNGITSEDRYVAMFEKFSDSKSINYKYFTHRKEEGKYLDTFRKEFGFEIFRNDVPIEMFMVQNGFRPNFLVGTASTAIDFLHWYSSGNQDIEILKFPEDYYVGKRSKHIQLIQEYHIRNHKKSQ